MIVKQKSFGSMANNCFLIIDEGTNKSALVDCSEYNQNMIDLIGDTELEYILLTHGHYDHIIGTKDVKDNYGAKVVISKEDANMLNSARHSLAIFCNAPQNNVDADIIVNDGDAINLGDIEIKVISTPGHTKGSVCYKVEDYLFTGDTLFYCSCGRTDFPTGDDYEMAQSLKLLKSMEGNYKVMTGHDKCSSLDFERNNNPYMKRL